MNRIVFALVFCGIVGLEIASRRGRASTRLRWVGCYANLVTGIFIILTTVAVWIRDKAIDETVELDLGDLSSFFVGAFLFYSWRVRRRNLLTEEIQSQD